MSQGFVGAPSLPVGLQWFSGFASHLMFGMKGEAIGHNDGTKMAWLSAARCPKCRLILASY
jgi:hypothetical protein